MKRLFIVFSAISFLICSPACLMINLGEIRMGMDSAQVNDGAEKKSQEQKPLSEEEISE